MLTIQNRDFKNAFMPLMKIKNKKVKGAVSESLKTVAYVVMGFFLALSFNTFLGLALQTDTPVVAVFSNSMVPTFYKGDMIIVQGPKDLKVGDVIIFDTDRFSYPIIHRIQSIDEDGITTKGDNNPVSDPWKVKPESVHGKTILKLPGLGWVKITALSILGV